MTCDPFSISQSRFDSNHAKERGNPVFRLPNVNLCCSVHKPFQLVELGSTRAASVVVLIYSSFYPRFHLAKFNKPLAIMPYVCWFRHYCHCGWLGIK